MKWLVLLLGLGACAPETPHWERYCAASHTQDGFLLMPQGDGTLMPYPTTDVVCDHYDSTWVVPTVTRT